MSQELKSPVIPLAMILHHMGYELPEFTAENITVIPGSLPNSLVMTIAIDGAEYKFQTSNGTLDLLFGGMDLPEFLPEGELGLYKHDGVYTIVVDPEMTYEEALNLTGYAIDMKYVRITEFVGGNGAELNISYPFFEGKVTVINAKQEEVKDEGEDTDKKDGDEPQSQQPQETQPPVKPQQQHQPGNKHKNRH